jgi:ubiquinone/menaquinone biosynthesis C-methylase UbiE
MKKNNYNNKERFYVNYRHSKSKRDYLKRVRNNKIHCMKIARKFDFYYWDGDRKYGYGGYKYIEGYQAYLAKKLIKEYKLNKNSKILDIGCGKGFLIYELKKILKGNYILGCDISSYAIKNSKKEIKNEIFKHDAKNKFKFKKNYFDLVISINTLHNLNIPNASNALEEIDRIGKNKYICVESYRNETEQFGAESWALTAKTIIDKKSWKWLFEVSNYKGEYEFIYFA